MAGKRNLPDNATKREKFVFYANTRVNTAVEAIDNLGKLNNADVYESAKADHDALAKAIEDALARMKAAFANPTKQAAAANAVIK